MRWVASHAETSTLVCLHVVDYRWNTLGHGLSVACSKVSQGPTEGLTLRAHSAQKGNEGPPVPFPHGSDGHLESCECNGEGGLVPHFQSPKRPPRRAHIGKSGKLLHHRCGSVQGMGRASSYQSLPLPPSPPRGGGVQLPAKKAPGWTEYSPYQTLSKSPFQIDCDKKRGGVGGRGQATGRLPSPPVGGVSSAFKATPWQLYPPPRGFRGMGGE